MIIDTFTHIYPRSYLNALPAAARDLDLEAYLDQVAAFTEPAARLEVMDRHGIQTQILTLGYPPALENMDDEAALRVARIANDAIGEIVQTFPGRFIGAATVPLNNPRAGLEEWERCRRDLGLHVLQMFTHVNGRPLDWAELMPLYATACDEQIPILLHPINARVSYDWIGEHKLDRLFGWPFDTCLAISRMAYGGVFQRFPELKVVAHHAGAMISFYRDRIFSYAFPDSPAIELSEKNRVSEASLDAFRSVYVDTVQAWKPALQCACEFFGSDHMVFGSDFPWGPYKGERYIEYALAAVRSLEVSSEARAAIFEGNAKALFQRAIP
jgi:aminocarboxymuconate-semialdehyde decarboxylase